MHPTGGFSPQSGFFYRKGRKYFIEGAKASRPLRNLCVLCGKKKTLCDENPQRGSKKNLPYSKKQQVLSPGNRNNLFIRHSRFLISNSQYSISPAGNS
jgi:hypothetical protein